MEGITQLSNRYSALRILEKYKDIIYVYGKENKMIACYILKLICMTLENFLKEGELEDVRKSCQRIVQYSDSQFQENGNQLDLNQDRPKVEEFISNEFEKVYQILENDEQQKDYKQSQNCAYQIDVLKVFNEKLSSEWKEKKSHLGRSSMIVHEALVKQSDLSQETRTSKMSNNLRQSSFLQTQSTQFTENTMITEPNHDGKLTNQALATSLLFSSSDSIPNIIQVDILDKILQSKEKYGQRKKNCNIDLNLLDNTVPKSSFNSSLYSTNQKYVQSPGIQKKDLQDSIKSIIASIEQNHDIELTFYQLQSAKEILEKDYLK